MGDISGSDIFAASRERHPDIAALFLTGYHDEAAAVKALNLGASKYLYKPVSTEQLLSVVQGLLDESQIAAREPILIDRSRADRTLLPRS